MEACPLKKLKRFCSPAEPIEQLRKVDSLNSQLVCIHGFLGQASDWDFLNHSLSEHVQISCFNLFGHEPPAEWGLSALGQKISSFANTRTSSNEQSILVGYSLGGRIALHSLLDSKSNWNKAVIISAHPGLKDSLEKSARLKADQAWAEKWLQEPWDAVLSAWNDQSVLRGIHPPPARNEKDFLKASLGKALVECSLGLQEDLREKIAPLEIPILWLAGDLDPKFRDLALEMQKLNSKITTVIIPNAGHRLLMDQPEIVRKLILDFTRI